MGFVFYLFKLGSNSVVFWGLAVAIAVVVCYQIRLSSVDGAFGYAFAEVVATFVLLQLTSIANAGSHSIYWLDSYYEVRATDIAITSGWDPNTGILGSVGGYPAVHFLTGTISQTIGASVFEVARWMGLLTYTAAFVFYLAFARRTFRDIDLVLYSGIAISFMFYFVMVTGLGRMPFSVAIFFMILFLFVCNLKKPCLNLIATSLVCLWALVLSHPMAPIVLGAFFINLLILIRFRRALANESVTSTGPMDSMPRKMGASSVRIYTLLVLVITTAYVVNVSIWSQDLLASTVSLLRGFTPVQEIGTGSSMPLHWRVFLYGQGVFGITLAAFVTRRPSEAHGFSINAMATFSFFVIAWMFVAYYLRIELIRFTIFIWPFLLLSGFGAIRIAGYKRLIPVFVVSFVLINIAGYFPDTYDRSLLPSRGEIYQYVSEQELVSVSSLNVSGVVVSNHYIGMAFLYMAGKEVNSNGIFFLEGYKHPGDTSYFYLDQRDRQWIFTREDTPGQYPFVSDELYRNYQQATYMLRIYDNGEVEAYHILR